jgi:hypothetical protein
LIIVKNRPLFSGVSIEGMNIGSLGKVLANQAIETTKNTVKNAVLQPDPPNAAKPDAPGQYPPADTGGVIVGQIQAMQRPLKEDQELAVTFRAGNEMLRVTEIFVPSAHILVFAGLDPAGNVTRVITPVDAAQVICKVMPVSPGANPIRVNVLTPKPLPKPVA